MPCNGNYHDLDCTCGFGGQGSGNSTRSVKWVGWGGTKINREVYHSYTCPNAKCPICGATVFFYQSPSGGRVFFDALGVPWPKHPCTSSNVDAFPIPAFPDVTRPAWLLEGWFPFHCTAHRDHVIIGSILKGGPYKESITCYYKRNRKRDYADPKYLLQIRTINAGIYLLSAFDVNSYSEDRFEMYDKKSAITHRSLSSHVPLEIGEELTAVTTNQFRGESIYLTTTTRLTNLNLVLEKWKMKNETWRVLRSGYFDNFRVRVRVIKITARTAFVEEM